MYTLFSMCSYGSTRRRDDVVMIIDTGAVLRAHSYMHIERPPLLWDLSADPEGFFRLLGEMISRGLTRGNQLGELTLKADNMTIDPDGPTDPGDYVGITVLGTGDWLPEQTWPLDLGSEGSFVTLDLHEAAAAVELIFGYTRVLKGDSGSITVFFPASRAISDTT